MYVIYIYIYIIPYRETGCVHDHADNFGETAEGYEIVNDGSEGARHFLPL